MKLEFVRRSAESQNLEKQNVKTQNVTRDVKRILLCSRNFLLALPILMAAVLLWSCKGAGTDANLPHATVTLRDGTQVAGKVQSTSPTEVTLMGDDNAAKTYPMAQVKSIEYDDAAASASSSAADNSASPDAPRPSARARSSQAEHEHHYHPTQAEIRTKTYRLPVGTQVSVRTEDTIDSAKAVEGQTFAAEITDDVTDENGDVVIPHGSNAQVIIRSASKGNRFHGQSDLVLDLQSISVEGQEYMVSTTDVQEKGKQGIGGNKRTAEYTGGGAALGAVIGAIAGHGKGAAIGAASGAGAGALTQILTKGGAIKLPPETLLTFKLDKPVKIVVAQ